MRKIVLITSLASVLFASDISINTLGFNLGISHSDYSQKDNQGSITLGNKPDKIYKAGEVYTTLNGLLKNSTMKPYVSLTYSTNTELKHQYLLAGVNKYYKINNLDIYAGILAGYGELTWKYDPLNSSKNKDYTSTSPMIGIQGGILFPYRKNIQIGINAKYMLSNYKTNLEPTSSISSEIIHNRVSFIGIGFNFSFNDYSRKEVTQDKTKEIIEDKKPKENLAKKSNKIIVQDKDKDGVVDRLDKCPNTKYNTKVSSTGCKVPNTYMVNFDISSSLVNDSYTASLQNIIAFLKISPNYNIEIQGFTDKDGDENDNMRLSQLRINSVLKIIRKNGIEFSRINTIANGEKLNISKSYKEKSKDRRVEINFYK